MPRAPKASSSRLFDRNKSPWYVDLVFFVFLFAVAYVLAVVIYIVAYKLVQIPQGELMDDSMRPAFMYIILMIAIGFCLLPMFNTEWDQTLRRFGLLVSIFIVLFTGGESLGVFALNPEGSLRQVIDALVHPLATHIKAPNFRLP